MVSLHILWEHWGRTGEMLPTLRPACGNVQFTTTGTEDTNCDKLQMALKSTSQNEFAEMGKAGEIKRMMKEET